MRKIIHLYFYKAFKKSLFLLLFFGGIFIQHIHSQNVVDYYGQLSVSGTKIIGSQGTPVQLRGMSFFWSQWQGKYYNYNVVQWLRDDWKCTVVRPAMAVDEAGGYISSPATEQQKVESVVDAAIALGIYVVIDFHSHHAEDYEAQAITFFGAMAQKYGSYPNVMYELYNEPLAVNWSTVIKPYCEKVIAEIRKYDPDNIIICGTPNWSQDVDAAANNPITKYTNIAYTLHYYANTHGDALRAKGEYAMSKGLALFVTEFGTCNASGDGGFNATASNVWWDWCDLHDISWCNWAVSDKAETASCLTGGSSVDGNWTSTNLTQSGALVRTELINKYVPPVITNEPVISSHPKNVSAYVGESVTLRVIAFGAATLQYQWKKNSVAITGETSANLTINPVSLHDNASYSVVVSNSFGTVESNIASLTISIPPPAPYITFTNTPIVIDGIAGNSYSTPYPITTNLIGTPTSTDLSGTWTAKWDNTNVYIFVSVIDQTLYSNTTATNWYTNDGVEIFFDANNEKASTYDTNDFQIGFVWNSTTINAGANNKSTITGVNYKMIKTTTGYNLEASIPWSTLKTTASAGKLVGFDIGINDNDGTGRVNKISWHQNQDEGWQFPNVLGEITLLQTPPIPQVLQTISFKQGWNLVSFYAIPTDNTIQHIFGSSLQNVQIIKNQNGFYAPSMNEAFQSITKIELGKGYMIHVTTPFDLIVSGTESTSQTINLKKGWNLIGTQKSTSTAITSAIQSISTEFQMIKDYNEFYEINNRLSQLNTIVPGNGYYILVNKDCILGL